MKRASRLLLVAGLIGGAAVATPSLTTAVAHAQPRKEPPPPPGTDAARKLFEEGKRKRDAGDKAGAFASFKAADDLIKAPTTKLAVARALVALDMLIEARQAAAEVEQIPKAPKESQPFMDARQSAVELVKELDGRIPSLTITLVEGPRTDETVVVGVTLDGEPLAQDKLGSPMKLNPGKHVVIGTLDGKSTTREVMLAEKTSESVALTLRGPDKPPPPPPPPPKVAAPRSPLVYAGLGVAVVGLGVGAVAGIVSMGKTSDVETQCRDLLCPPPAHETLDEAKTWATVSTIGFIGAGIGLALAGVGFFVLKPKPPASATATKNVQLMMTASGLGGVF